MSFEPCLAFAAWFLAMPARLLQPLRRDSGQGIMEYAILLGAIALIAAVALYASGGLDFTDMRNTIQDCISFSSSCG